MASSSLEQLRHVSNLADDSDVIEINSNSSSYVKKAVLQSSSKQRIVRNGHVYVELSDEEIVAKSDELLRQISRDSDAQNAVTSSANPQVRGATNGELRDEEGKVQMKEMRGEKLSAIKLFLKPSTLQQLEKERSQSQEVTPSKVQLEPFSDSPPQKMSDSILKEELPHVSESATVKHTCQVGRQNDDCLNDVSTAINCSKEIVQEKNSSSSRPKSRKTRSRDRRHCGHAARDQGKQNGNMNSDSRHNQSDHERDCSRSSRDRKLKGQSSMSNFWYRHRSSKHGYEQSPRPDSQSRNNRKRRSRSKLRSRSRDRSRRRSSTPKSRSRDSRNIKSRSPDERRRRSRLPSKDKRRNDRKSQREESTSEPSHDLNSLQQQPSRFKSKSRRAHDVT